LIKLFVWDFVERLKTGVGLILFFFLAKLTLFVRVFIIITVWINGHRQQIATWSNWSQNHWTTSTSSSTTDCLFFEKFELCLHLVFHLLVLSY
jgi:hypothetical protein